MSTTLPSTVRRAETALPINGLLAERWSPRSFDPVAEIGDDQLTTMLEAARWAPSAANFQPRRFIVARRGSEEFERIVSALSEGNKPWAVRASVLVVGVAVSRDQDGKPFRWAEYDLGQSLAHLTVQAHAEGLHVHQMGGFDAARISALFELPEEFTPLSVTTIGVVSDASQLEEPYAAREVAARTRLPLEDLVIGTR